nr:hypothetical protein [Bosea sp. (in: a-proteobacteria)]
MKPSFIGVSASPRANDVDADIVRREALGEGFGQSDDGELRRRIDRTEHRPDQARDRGREDDRAAAALAHVTDDLSRCECGGGDVECDGLIIGDKIEVLDAAGAGNAGMSPEDVDAAERCRRVVDRTPHLVGLREIRLNRHDLIALRRLDLPEGRMRWLADTAMAPAHHLGHDQGKAWAPIFRATGLAPDRAGRA